MHTLSLPSSRQLANWQFHSQLEITGISLQQQTIQCIKLPVGDSMLRCRQARQPCPPSPCSAARPRLQLSRGSAGWTGLVGTPSAHARSVANIRPFLCLTTCSPDRPGGRRRRHCLLLLGCVQCVGLQFTAYALYAALAAACLCYLHVLLPQASVDGRTAGSTRHRPMLKPPGTLTSF